jgi:hypothetical protein
MVVCDTPDARANALCDLKPALFMASSSLVEKFMRKLYAH